MTNGDVVPVKVFNQVSQLAHVAGGLAAVWGSIVLFGQSSIWIAMVSTAAVTAVKEFWYDQHYETEVVRGSNLEDWTFYQVGSVSAMLLTFGVQWLRAYLNQ